MSPLGYIPFSDLPGTAQWDFPITRSDYTKILGGYRPLMMEDKWSVKTEESAEGGNTIMRALWGWKNHERMRLTIAPGDPRTENSEAKDWAKIVSIQWKLLVNGEGVSEAKAKRNAVAMCNVLCGCELEAEPIDSDTGVDDDKEDESEDEAGADDSNSDSDSSPPSATPLPSTSCPNTEGSPPADTS